MESFVGYLVKVLVDEFISAREAELDKVLGHDGVSVIGNRRRVVPRAKTLVWLRQGRSESSFPLRFE